MIEFQVILDVIQQYAVIITTVVTLAASVSAITPNQVDNKIIQFIVDLLNVLGLNIGTAKNAE